MVADTLRQKFIYAIPFDKQEFPLVKLDNDITVSSINSYKIKASDLYFYEKENFYALINNIKFKHDSVIILNDYNFNNRNTILYKGCLCYIMSFAYLFKQSGLKCNII